MKATPHVAWILGLLLSIGLTACDVCDPEQEPPAAPRLHGIVRDAITGEPLPDIEIDDGDSMVISDPDGRFDVPAVDDTIELTFRDEGDPNEYGAYFDFDASFRPDSSDTITAWMIPNVEMESDSFPDFLSWLKYMLTQRNISPHSKERLETWRIPFEVYVPPFMLNGLDYQQSIKDVWDAWEQLVGFDLVTFVDEVPTVGVYIEYIDHGRESHFIKEVSDDGFPKLARIHVTYNYDTTNVHSHLYKIVGHEIGHAFCMGHSNDRIHLMVAGRAPLGWPPTYDEIWLVRVMYRLPRGVRFENYKLD
ncbi:MAG: hypothetical protein JSW58_16625 [Candidatus Latescibacterota bacterium]|nr:MAG: hypothetical protein JSW58_16625 [Candidatus Latescibacterota bacterium]